MSTTAELRSITEQLVAELAGGPHEQLARQVAMSAGHVAQVLESVHNTLSSGVLPVTAEACATSLAAPPSPMPVPRSLG